MALTVEDVYEYVGIEAEYADEIQQRRAEHALKAARMWIVGAVGVREDLENPYEWMEWPLAEETMLMAAGQLYEDKTLVDANLSKYAGGAKQAAALSRLANDALSQLKYCTYVDFDPLAPISPEEPEEPPVESLDPDGSTDPTDTPDSDGGGEDQCQLETQ